MITTTAATTTPHDDAGNDAAQVRAGTLEHLDPNSLLIGANVRDDATLDAHFIASVREHAVLQPITAIRSEHVPPLIEARTQGTCVIGMRNFTPSYTWHQRSSDLRLNLFQRDPVQTSDGSNCQVSGVWSRSGER